MVPFRCSVMRRMYDNEIQAQTEKSQEKTEVLKIKVYKIIKYKSTQVISGFILILSMNRKNRQI